MAASYFPSLRPVQDNWVTLIHGSLPQLSGEDDVAGLICGLRLRWGDPM